MSKAAFAEELAALSAVLGALEPLDGEKRVFVLRTTMDRLGVSASSATGGFSLAKVGSDGTGADLGAPPDLARTTPKEFLRLKQPITDVQRIACLAYYLARARGIAQFKTLDLTKINTEAAGAKFSNAAVAVNNATLAGFFAAAGGGKKQITALGEDVVDALPDQERAKMAVAASKNRRRRRAAKKAVKKAVKKG